MWIICGALRNVPIGGGCRKNRRAVRRVSPDVLNDDRSKNVTIILPKENVSTTTTTPWGIDGDNAIKNVEIEGFRINGCDRSVSTQIAPDLFNGQDFVFVDDWCNNFGLETLWQWDGGDFIEMESMAKIQDRDQMLFNNTWGSFDFSNLI
ncbi:hypothetical protein M569_13399 [Genlisea aurea]|uniref:Uncharacterized protein n=1 Tax=Genlisea aurea TaxID=192259 RepID=S8C3M1_9LAMI|nr:hypothetical protein M569_13399 [Genlisea aurea]